MVDSVGQAGVLLKPLRIALLRELGEPKSCPELAETFEDTPQKMYYHVKTMERAGLVERCGERSVNGIAEGFYRACAQSFWLSPRLVKRFGGARAVRDATSLHMLASHAEELLEDVARLAGTASSGEHVPSLSLSADVSLPESRRAEFLEELRTTFEDLARRYAQPAGPDSATSSQTPQNKSEHPQAAEVGPASFRFTLSCYPTTTREGV